MPTRTYVGPVASGSVTFPDDSFVSFVAGVPVDVTADQAALLDRTPDEWTGGKAKKADPPTEPATAQTQEP